jgi:hypothetical protein
MRIHLGSFVPSKTADPLYRYLLKITVTVFVVKEKGDREKVDRVKCGVRSALKLALGEGWI